MVRPALYATFLLDRSLYGTNPFGYHVLNLLLHLGSGLLVYLILNRAVTEETKHVPLWTALLFLIHPMATETVTYISGRASGLMTFLYLFAFFLYIKASEHSDAAKVRRLYLSGSVLSLILSLGSKETAATFPLVLLLWDLLIRRLRGTSAPHCDSVRASAVLDCSASSPPHGHRCTLVTPPRTVQFHATAYLGQSTERVTCHRLCTGVVLHSLEPELRSRCAPAALVGRVAAASRSRSSLEDWPRLRWSPSDLSRSSHSALAWYVVQLLPTTLIPRNDLLSERNLYLASAGILLAVVVLASSLTHRLSSTMPRLKLARIATGILAASAILGPLHRNRIRETSCIVTRFYCGPTQRRNRRRKQDLITTSATPMRSRETGIKPSTNSGSPPGWTRMTCSLRTIFATRIFATCGRRSGLVQWVPALNMACP